MSYDLAFWRQTESYQGEPESTYHRLVEGDSVEGLQVIDIETMLAAIQAQFPGVVREPNGDEEWMHYVREDGKGSDSGFEVTWSSQHLLVTCRRSSNEDMNAFIDIAQAGGCALYDPQVNERFD